MSVHWGDAMSVDLAGLRPTPGKVVANLPYGIAAGVLLRTIEELPKTSGLWVAMVQREVGERLAAAPGGGAYGVSSVIAQLACEVSVLRAIPRTVFYPRAERRLGARGHAPARRRPPSPALRALVGGAFAHRRKTLAGSLALAGRGGGSAAAEGVRPGALAIVGARARRSAWRWASSAIPTDVRAERLAPEDFRELGRVLDI